MLSLSHVRFFVTLRTVARQAPLSMGILQARILEWVAVPSSGGSSQPRDPNAGLSPALQVDFLLSEPPGKPKNTGMGSLSLLQGIFPIQKLNRGLLHCRPILYQLSYQGSPVRTLASNNKLPGAGTTVHLFVSPTSEVFSS